MAVSEVRHINVTLQQIERVYVRGGQIKASSKTDSKIVMSAL